VVAEEVRQLAEQSAGAAREIGQLINQIRSGVDTAIKSMEQGVDDVSEGVHLASEAGVALDGIIQAINQNIALIEDITLGARQTSTGTQQLMASNEQVTSTIQQVAGATQELSDIAGKLQMAVDRFKV
jgi:methyl-accepting chemotaxis protein